MTAPSGGFAPQASGGESRFMTARVRLTGFGPGHTTGREGGEEHKRHPGDYMSRLIL